MFGKPKISSKNELTFGLKSTKFSTVMRKLYLVEQEHLILAKSKKDAEMVLVENLNYWEGDDYEVKEINPASTLFMEIEKLCQVSKKVEEFNDSSCLLGFAEIGDGNKLISVDLFV